MKSKGFTLIEVVMSIAILVIGVLGVFTVIQRIIGFTSGINSRLTAVYLAQEGIENTRNIRDSNWLEQRYDPSIAWNDGIVTGGWETINNKFQRRITITSFPPNKIVVSVQVRWTERGGTSEVTGETQLYDWR